MNHPPTYASPTEDDSPQFSEHIQNVLKNVGCAEVVINDHQLTCGGYNA